MPDGSRWTQVRGGFFTWVTLPFECDTSALLPAALAARTAFVAGQPFYADSRRSREMRLSFSRVHDTQIDEGVRRLAEVVVGMAP
jgi:DNA-binding transcriptional MocR family regulator